MEKELHILTQISQNESITQRQLAKDMGLSLGTINSLMKRMAEKKFLILQQNSKSIRYVLTPKGLKEKAMLTYNHTVDSYRVISKLRTNTKNLIEDQIEKGIKKFYLYGEKDEVYKIIKMSIIAAKRMYNIDYVELESMNHITELDSVVLTWNISNEFSYKSNDVVLNVFNY